MRLAAPVTFRRAVEAASVGAACPIRWNPRVRHLRGSGRAGRAPAFVTSGLPSLGRGEGLARRPLARVRPAVRPAEGTWPLTPSSRRQRRGTVQPC
jgi:hypothetical protein